MQHRVSLQRTQPAVRRQSGFTLIELMIVVAIVGILSAIAIPQYQDYMARAQVTEALTLASAQKVAVVETFSQTGTCPDNGSNAVGGIPVATGIKGTYVAKVEVGGSDSACTITATFEQNGVSKGLSQKTLTLTMGGTEAGAVTWVCTSSALGRYLPQSCTGTSATTTTPEAGGGTGA